MANMVGMSSDTEPRRSGIYNIVGVGLALVIVLGAAALFIINSDKLRQPTPGQALTAALLQHFPDAQPAVSFGGDTIIVSLQVSFDPAVDAETASKTFQRAQAVASEQALEQFSEIKIELTGLNIEGQETSTSLTSDYVVVEDPSSY